MPGHPKCRDCENLAHHWVRKPTRGKTPERFACKHCPAIGGVCPDCGGYGHGADIANGPNVDDCENCIACDGLGVIQTSSPSPN